MTSNLASLEPLYSSFRKVFGRLGAKTHAKASEYFTNRRVESEADVRYFYDTNLVQAC